MSRSKSLAGGEDVKQAGREGGDDDMQLQVDAVKPVSLNGGSIGGDNNCMQVLTGWRGTGQAHAVALRDEQPGREDDCGRLSSAGYF